MWPDYALNGIFHVKLTTFLYTKWACVSGFLYCQWNTKQPTGMHHSYRLARLQFKRHLLSLYGRYKITSLFPTIIPQTSRRYMVACCRRDSGVNFGRDYHKPAYNEDECEWMNRWWCDISMHRYFIRWLLVWANSVTRQPGKIELFTRETTSGRTHRIMVSLC